MPRLILIPFFLFSVPAIVFAQAVEDTNGSVVGTFGSTDIEVPVLCERAPFVTVRSHGANGMPAFEAAIMPTGIVSMEIRTDEFSRQFGATIPASSTRLEFPMTIAGDIDGFDYSFEVICPAEFAG